MSQYKDQLYIRLYIRITMQGNQSKFTFCSAGTRAMLEGCVGPCLDLTHTKNLFFPLNACGSAGHSKKRKEGK